MPQPAIDGGSRPGCTTTPRVTRFFFRFRYLRWDVIANTKNRGCAPIQRTEPSFPTEQIRSIANLRLQNSHDLSAPGERGGTVGHMSLGGLRTAFLSWRAGAVAGLLAAFAYILQIEVGRHLPAWAHWLTVSVGALFTILAVALPALEARQERRAQHEAVEIAKAARRDAIVAMHGLLRAALDGLMRIATEPSPLGRRERKERMKQLIVDIASEIRPDARACYFSQEGDAPTRILRWDGVWRPKQNRHLEPRREFKEGDKAAGDDMFMMIDEGPGSCRIVRNADAQHPQGWFHGAHDYKNYIAVPVVTNSRKFGFVGVDTPSADDLTENDVNTMRLLASILSVALAINE